MAKKLTSNQFEFRQQRKKAPSKVKNEDQSVTDDKVLDDGLYCLKSFDMDSCYGPAIGLTRLERWERAYNLGLNPDLKVKEFIQQHSNDPEYTHPIWHSTIVDST